MAPKKTIASSQAAFRVQSPWTIKNPDGASPNEELILKEECYIFDFAPERTLGQIADYSCQLNVNEDNPEKKVEEFIRFLPVLAFDGSSMKQIGAAGVLDMAMSGTTATLLAKRWGSALLVNVDDDTLRRLMNHEAAMNALMRIEGFRNLNDVITQLEPSLFKKVTGLSVADFELLVSLGLFNSALMNDAVYKFKRYEDPSLVYMGINKQEGEDIGLYDTVLRREEYEATFINQDA